MNGVIIFKFKVHLSEKNSNYMTKDFEAQVTVETKLK